MDDVGELLASVRRRYATAARYSDAGRVVVSGGTLDGTTSGVAFHVPSMLLPDEIFGPALLSEEREYRLTAKPSSGVGFWVLETVVEPRNEILVGPDLLVHGLNVRGIVTNTTDLLIEYDPVLEGS